MLQSAKHVAPSDYRTACRDVLPLHRRHMLKWTMTLAGASGLGIPNKIQQKAEAEVPVEQIVKQWPVGTDPAVHTNRIRELFDSGVSIVNVHSGQPDQERVIEFYASHVLPSFS
jgi:F420-dependent hydroxymycolic acid dehydrogenase